jgi:ABC-type oligopeptide transport system substrate-binding subunit
VSPEPLEVPDFEEAVGAHSGPGAWILTAPADLAVPEDVLEALFRSQAAGNTAGFRDERLDQALDRARTAADDGERERAYAEAEDRACELMPLVPLWAGVSHWAFNPDKVVFEGSPPIDASGGLLLRQAKPRR